MEYLNMQSYRIYDWFYNYNLIFLVIFIVITLAVCVYAFRLYRLTKQSRLRELSIAFGAISLGYIVRLVTLLLMGSGVIEIIRGTGGRGGLMKDFGGLRELMTLHGILGNIHAILILAGLLILVLMTFKQRDKRMVVFLFGTVLLAILFTPHLMLVGVLSTFFLLFLVHYYFRNWRAKKHFSTLLVLLAFVFLLISQLSLICALHSPVAFLVGKVIEMLAYLAILTNLIILHKK